ncbi:unnamed protein product [Durusdinium trenchii]|uniref:Major facilitator superfamily (MFS) profile domain-containing protein n=1 Tax=Durusdinium trenchii TaxID=1381693 RepID=A0ABP0SZH3_9DINO
MELHMDDAEEVQDWAKALRLHTERSVPKASPKAVASPTSPSKDEVEELSEQADEECSLLRAKSQKLQQRIATLETLSDRREKQMKRLLKRLDGAMQMLEALEDMCGQQRKVISAQQQAISALKEEGAVDDDEEEEEAETGDDSNREDMDLSEEKMMALLQQAQQMEQALKQIEALSKAGGAGPQAEGDVEAILSRLHALEEEKANFDRMARRESAWAVRKAHSSDEVLGREDRDCGDSDWSWRSPRLQSLGLLLLACVANQACRALPFYLVDFGDGKAGQAMNQDLDFNSADYGFFATLCFSVPFTLTSLWAGVMADRMDRFQLTAFAGVAWSLSTAGMAVASSYGGLLLLRVALGLSQAATNPAALSLIAELFPDARATANSIFGLGIYLGGALASLGAFVDEQEGWRAACLVFGFFSVAASLPALTKRDEKQAPVRRSTWPADDMDLQTRLASLPEAAATVWESSTEAVAPTGARWLLLASALRFSAGFAILVWLPSSVRATFPNDVEQFAIVNSLIKGFAGSISSISGGLAADALRSRGFGDRSAAWFCAASSILSAPLWYFTLADGFSFEVCMGFLCAEYLVAESWLGAAISALQGAVPADRRGTAQGVFSSLTAPRGLQRIIARHRLGQALPVGLGLLAPEDLTQGLQLSVSVCYCLSGLCFLIASSHLSQEVPQDER